MPVTLNEPLSTLQRLCEELEYSDLIDKAVLAPTPLERLMYCSWFLWTKRNCHYRWVAAFSISAYGSSNARASHKPFNPLLGETFECIREDKGFRYVAEQVSPSSSQDLMIMTNWPRLVTILPSLGFKRTAPDGHGVRLGLPFYVSCVSFFFVGNVNTWNLETWRTCG